MSDDQKEQRAAILGQVESGLDRAEAHVKRFRRWEVRLLITSIVLGTLATALAGGAAASGDSAAGMVGGWRVLCFIVAVFAAGGTISGALHKSFRITNRLTDAVMCMAKLQSLKLAITVTQLSPEKAAGEYRAILEQHSDSLM